MNELLVIKKVKEYDCLFNIHSRNYRDRNIRQETWEEIGTEMNIPASLVKDTWTRLRHCYMMALKRRLPRKSGGTAKRSRPWKYEQEMSFLKPFLPNRDNLQETFPEFVGVLDEGNEDYKHEINHESEIEMEETSESDVLSQSSFSSVNKTNTGCTTSDSKNLTSAEEMVQEMKRDDEYRKSKQNYELDESDMFYLSMSKQAKRLPELDQAKIKLEICRLIQEAEIRKLENQATNARTFTDSWSSTRDCNN